MVKSFGSTKLAIHLPNLVELADNSHHEDQIPQQTLENPFKKDILLFLIFALDQDQNTMMNAEIKIGLLFFLFLSACLPKGPSPDSPIPTESSTIADTLPSTPQPLQVGAERLDQYLNLLKGKTVGLVVNQTSMIGNQHLVDSLLSLGISIKAIFAPEHGFRGTADAGAAISNGKDTQTGLPILTLYGPRKQPSKEDLSGIDWMIFDIQDVGARFYTYISTMHYVMESCAKYDINFLVLDRPNPNGHFVDGPILEPGYQSFVGMHPIPVVHGMTVGEYAQMINGEAWLKEGAKCALTVIPCANYDHQQAYNLPIKPSPNLPNMTSIYLYPSLCFFEGTVISIGRGTDRPFQLIGHPDLEMGEAEFVPESTSGASRPKLEGKRCRGVDLSERPLEELREKGRLDLSYLLEAYASFPEGKTFFLKNNFFDKLAGTKRLRMQVKEGKSEAEIRASWREGVEAFKKVRAKYLLYP